MKVFEEILQEEKGYLKKVIEFLKEEIGIKGVSVDEQKKNLLQLRKEMWEEGPKSSDEFDRVVDMSQYFVLEAIETSQYKHRLERLKQYQKVLDKPYFGRFDFQETEEESEAIYIGYHNLMNDATYEVMVYDWRAPIASIFYRNEVGKASYMAPCGKIDGEVQLKRQYEIVKGELAYFFDCNLTITDELLQQALGKNASSHMQNIVETIQKEQDQIIRDQDHDLLMVQGVAGSGKTSIAMHRVAFLLYDRLEEGLKSNQVIIISPNQMFGEYIAEVLPELGEESVRHLTVEEIFEEYFGGINKTKDRLSQLDYMLGHESRQQLREIIAFKGSQSYCKLLDGLIEQIEKQLVVFEDVYYDAQCIFTKEALKQEFFDNPVYLPITKRLNRLEHRILAKVKPLEKEKRRAIQKQLEKSGDLGVDEEQSVQILLDRYKKELMEQIKKFTKIDCVKYYKQLFENRQLWEVVTKSVEVPVCYEQLQKNTLQSLSGEWMNYEDSLAVLYLKIHLEGVTLYPSIRQVVVDEAQDYYPIQYKIFGQLFKGAQFTVIGDIAQTIEKQEEMSLYDKICESINPKLAIRLTLNKSYRSSYEINTFAKKLRGDDCVLIPFERHEKPPMILKAENEEELLEIIIQQVEDFIQDGLETVVILCKTNKEVYKLASKLEPHLPAKKITKQHTHLEKGILVMPIYMAKGLEYDGVILYEINENNYSDLFDRQILYVGCTRALHRLSLVHTGTLSSFLRE